MNLRAIIAAALTGGAVGAGVVALAFDDGVGNTETFRQLEIFGDVLATVKQDYVNDVDDSELIEAAIQGMLRSLDPHSSYLDPDAHQDLRVATSGEYGGLGIEIIGDSGVVKVVAPIDNTPASRAGVQSGDYIISVDGDSIVGTPMDEILELLRGDVGAPVTITIIRETEDDPFDITLVRERIQPEVVSHRIEDDTIGYVRIATFNERAAGDLVTAIEDLKSQLGADFDGLVLDLRRNPGGLLVEGAVAVSDVFLDGGEVVSIRGRQARDIQRYNADPGDLVAGKPIVVIIDEGSASAAEIVAGALQDRERATIVGLPSFGKGSVQTVIPIGAGGEGGAVRLTTATYFTPASRSIQATGITPDFEIAARRGQRVGQGVSEDNLPNALQNLEGLERAEEHDAMDEPPEDYPEDGDYQLDRAIEILRDLANQS